MALNIHFYIGVDMNRMLLYGQSEGENIYEKKQTIYGITLRMARCL